MKIEWEFLNTRRIYWRLHRRRFNDWNFFSWFFFFLWISSRISSHVSRRCCGAAFFLPVPVRQRKLGHDQQISNCGADTLQESQIRFQFIRFEPVDVDRLIYRRNDHGADLEHAHRRYTWKSPLYSTGQVTDLDDNQKLEIRTVNGCAVSTYIRLKVAILEAKFDQPIDQSWSLIEGHSW